MDACEASQQVTGPLSVPDGTGKTLNSGALFLYESPSPATVDHRNFPLELAQCPGREPGHPGSTLSGHLEGTVTGESDRLVTGHHLGPGQALPAQRARHRKAGFDFIQDGALHLLVTRPDNLSSKVPSLTARRLSEKQTPAQEHWACCAHTLHSQPQGAARPLASKDLCRGESVLLTNMPFNGPLSLQPQLVGWHSLFFRMDLQRKGAACLSSGELDPSL